MSNQKLNFQYCCVSPADLEELQYIVDNNREITYKTFISKVDKEYIKEFNSNSCIPLDQDYAVSFHKSKTQKGKIVYYFRHSAIEYIFY